MNRAGDMKRRVWNESTREEVERDRKRIIQERNRKSVKAEGS